MTANPSMNCSSAPTVTCTGSRCLIGAQAFGFAFATDADGCETDTASNASHCGVCGRTCLDSQLCDRGACVSIPVLVNNFVTDAVSGLDGGPRVEYAPTAAADTTGNLLVTSPYTDIGTGASDLIALSPTLTLRWSPLDNVPFVRTASCNSTCVHWEMMSDRLMRHEHSRPIPVVAEMGRYSGTTSIAAMADGHFVALANEIISAPAAPQRALRVQHDGRVVVPGLSDRIYLSNGSRLVAADDAGLVWTWNAGSSATVVAASPSRELTPSGEEQGVYVMYARGGQTHVALIDASSGLTLFEEPLPFSDAPPFSVGTSIVALNPSTLIIAGHELTGPDTDSAFFAVLDWDFGVRHVWGLGNQGEHRVTHLVRLSDQEVAAVGLALGSALSTGGRSIPISGDSGSLFVLRLRVQ